MNPPVVVHLLRDLSAVALAAGLIAACARKDSASDADSVTSATSGPAATAANSPGALPAGEARLAVDGGAIWYKVATNPRGTPVILLHGGPGIGSYYLKSLEALGSDRPVVRYDQLGSGKSGGLTDTTKMTIAHFVRELDSLRAHLGYNRVHIVGHSWGTILGLEYYRAHPEHVVSLTLASAALDIPEWERNAKRLVTTLSDSAQRAIRRREADKKFDAPDYQVALQEFYGRYVWLHPVQADLDSTFQQMNEQIYGYLQGPSEFTITGTLKRYDATPRGACPRRTGGGHSRFRAHHHMGQSECDDTCRSRTSSARRRPRSASLRLRAFRSLWPPKQICCRHRSHDRAAVAERVDQLVQVLYLQTVVQRVLEPVRPVEERQHADAEQDESRQGVQHDRVQVRITGRRKPPERKRQAEQEHQRRHQHGRRHPSGAEEQPEQRLDRSPVWLGHGQRSRNQKMTAETTIHAP